MSEINRYQNSTKHRSVYQTACVGRVFDVVEAAVDRTGYADMLGRAG